MVVPIFKKGDQRVLNYWSITLLTLNRKLYSKVVERRLRLIVEPQNQEQQCRFCSDHQTEEQLFTLAGLLEDSWESSSLPVFCGHGGGL